MTLFYSTSDLNFNGLRVVMAICDKYVKWRHSVYCRPIFYIMLGNFETGRVAVNKAVNAADAALYYDTVE